MDKDYINDFCDGLAENVANGEYGSADVRFEVKNLLTNVLGIMAIDHSIKFFPYDPPFEVRAVPVEAIDEYKQKLGLVDVPSDQSNQ